MKPIFQISFPDKGIVQPVLALQIGEKHCSFAITDHSSAQLKQLCYYTGQQMDEASLSSVFSGHPELNQSFFRVVIGYQFAASTLIPAKYFQHEKQTTVLKVLFGSSSSMNAISESLSGWQMNVVYNVPQKIYRSIVTKFPAAKFWHQYSIVIQDSRKPGLYLDFRHEDFSAILIKGNKLLFAGCFMYSTPADVLYQLLKLIKTYDHSQQEVPLFISGLIDKTSALYAELVQYFMHPEFRDSDWETDQPAHYFTSLNDLAKCE